MLTVLDGKKPIRLSRADLEKKLSGSCSVVLDIGTGDGKNVYKCAKSAPGSFFIGVDPAFDNMTDTAVRSKKKPEKGGLSNMLLAVSAVEELPSELYDTADLVTCFFPWGVLLEWIAGGSERAFVPMKNCSRNGASFELVMTYSTLYEAAEIEKRGLPELSPEYLSGIYSKSLADMGFVVDSVSQHGNEFVKDFDSAWAKRLAYGRKRDFWRIRGTIEK